MGPSLPAFAATDPDIYEHSMGRWSARIADPFLSFAGVESGQRVLDGVVELGSLRWHQRSAVARRSV
jgi:hypothetical protein